MKKDKQKNFNVSADTLNKLIQLRNYHNKTFDSVFEILVQNAYLKMHEETNSDKSKEIEETNVKVQFQVQQLTLMFSSWKAELERLKIEKQALQEQMEEKINTLSEINQNQSKRISTLEGQITRRAKIEDFNQMGLYKGK